MELSEILHLVAFKYKLVLIRFWCISLKKFRRSKFLISLTQRYKTKFCTIVPNTNCFKPNNLKLKILIYNSNSKIICNFCTHEDNTLPLGEEVTPRPEDKIVYRLYVKKEHLKINKTNG